MDRWMLRAVKWARNPPSARMVVFVILVVAVCVLLYGVEKIWGWPEWLTVERVNRRGLR